MSSLEDRLSALSKDKLVLLAKKLSEQAKQAAPTEKERIALIGWGCRLPGGVSSARDLVRLLEDKRDAIGEIPADRWDGDAYYAEDPLTPGRMNSKWGGFIDDVRGFDHDFFGISKREATTMDPQQRIALEVAMDALDDAGIDPRALAGSKTGVFIGATTGDYLRLASHRPDRIDAYLGSGNAHCMIANRLSYLLDLRGPSLAFDTACSSSLVALHFASKALRSHAIDHAIVIGVNVIADPTLSLTFAKAGMFAPDGRCKTFDARANGFVRSEGCAGVVLRRESDAKKAGDRVHAYVIGTAVNQDGRTNGLTAPSGIAQQAVLREAVDDAGIDPKSVGYVEAHGTGTSLGDPIELEGVNAVYGAGSGRRSPLRVGSIKTNMGHTEAAAGLVGLLKAALSVERARIFPQLHFEKLNPEIRIDEHSVSIATTSEAWPMESPRRAAVSSFGFGGANAHAIVEGDGALPEAAWATEGTTHSIIVASGRTPEALRDRARSLAAYLDTNAPNVADIAFTTSTRRRHFDHRMAIVASDAQTAARALEMRLERPHEVAKANKLAFVFSGQGGQWWRMGQSLRDGDERFAAELAEVDAILGAHAGWTLKDALGAAEDATRTYDTAYAQPSLVALQIALSRWLRTLGIVPDVVLGHSVGELAAAAVSGVFSTEDAIRLAVERGILMQSLTGKGRMLAVALNEADAMQAAEAFDVEVAAVNGPEASVLAGPPEAIAKAHDSLTRDGVSTRPLRVDYAFHAYQAEPLMDALEAAARTITASPPETPLISTHTGCAVGDDLNSPRYWAEQMRSRVRFYDAMRTAIAMECDAFIEIGPHPTLTSVIADACEHARRPARLIASILKRDDDEVRSSRQVIAQAFECGQDIDFKVLFDSKQAPRPVDLPPYPWQHVACWVPDAGAERALPASVIDTTSAIVETTATAWFERCIAGDTLERLQQHAIDGLPTLPGALFVGWLLECAARIAGAAFAIEDISFCRIVPLGEPVRLVMSVEPPPGPRTMRIYALGASSRAHEEQAPCVTARLQAVTDGPLESRTPADGPGEPSDGFYAWLREHGMEYGPDFQTLSSVSTTDTEVSGQIRARDGACALSDSPETLDGALQLLGARARREARGPHVLSAIGRVRYEPVSSDAFAATLIASTDTSGDSLSITTKDGRATLWAEGIRAQALSGRHAELPHGTFAIEWQTATKADLLPSERLCIVGDTPFATALEHAVNGSIRVATLPRAATAREAGSADSRTHLVITFEGAVDGPDVAPTRASELAEETAAAFARELSELASRSDGNPPRITVVSASDSAEPGPVHAAVGGVALAFGREHPDFDVTALHARLANDAPRHVAEAIGRKRDLRMRLGDTGQLETMRLTSRATSATIGEDARPRTGVPRTDYRLECDVRGSLDALRYRLLEREPLGPNDIRIGVKAAALNFRDVLKALDLYPGLGQETVTFGHECSGVVLDVGAHADTFAVGDEVIAFTGSALATETTTDASLVFKKPGGLTHAEAATIPVVFATAAYALEHLARLRKGETVLVHGGAGGVGLAAIQIAKQIGARVIASAGTPEKRRLLEERGVDVVVPSRGLAFVPAVRSATDGRGVDVVLNSLSGDALTASLDLLARYGRFVEIGKRDIYGGSRLPLHAFRENLAFFALDLEQFFLDRPSEMAQLMDNITQRIETGVLSPLPHESYPLHEAERAFRTMAQGEHVGKVVLEPSCPMPPIAPRQLGRIDGTYVVTGASGGLGVECVRWLLDNGARRVVGVGRNAPDAGQWSALASSPAYRDRLEFDCADVSDIDAMRIVLDRADGDGALSLRGVVHAAGVLDDAPIADHDPARVARVFRPKAMGAAVLDALTRERDLRHFVVFSSGAALAGSPHQAAYTAANAFVESLCVRRQREGLTALAIAWGPWAEVGMARELGALFDAEGLAPIAPSDGAARFGRALRACASRVAILDFASDVREKPLGRLAMLAQILRTGSRSDGGSDAQPRLVRELSALDPDARARHLRAHLRDTVAELLKLEVSRVADRAPLFDLGLDSLVGLELKSRLERETGLTLAATLVFRCPHVEAMADHLIERMALGANEPTAAADAASVQAETPSRPSKSPESTRSADDVRNRLAERLRQLKRDP